MCGEEETGSIRIGPGGKSSDGAERCVCVNVRKSGEVCRECENGVNLEHCKWWRNCVINTGIVEQCAGPSRFVSHP